MCFLGAVVVDVDVSLLMARIVREQFALFGSVSCHVMTSSMCRDGIPRTEQRSVRKLGHTYVLRQTAVNGFSLEALGKLKLDT